MLQIETAVFRRILNEQVRERTSALTNAAVDAIAETMQETVRFGGFSAEYIRGCAQARLNTRLQG